MADCNHECSSCATSGGCQEKEQNERAINNTKGVKKVIGVVGGKGGVGKSLVTSLLAIQTRRLGYETAVLDADITGPSIPKIFASTTMPRPTSRTCCPILPQTAQRSCR